MALTACSVATNNIATVGTNVAERGLTTDQFKALFDKYGVDFVAWFNTTHLVELTAANVGAVDGKDYTHGYIADTGTANAYVVALNPAPTAYVAGQMVSFKVTNANTGASTLNVNGLGVKTIKKSVSLDLVTGDIAAGQIITAIYDGTNFQLISAAQGNRDISVNIPGDMFLTTGIVRYVVGSARTVSKVRLSIGSAPTGTDLIVDVAKNGTTIFTTQGNRPKIVAAATSGVSVAPDITALAEGDVITIDIDQVGSTLPGTGLAITLMCT